MSSIERRGVKEMSRDQSFFDTQLGYRNRFKEGGEARDRLWKTLCSGFFQKYIPESGSVLEIAAGYCEFINNITARRKIAVDINPDTRQYADKDIEVYTAACEPLDMIEAGSVDVVWISNFLEHIDKPTIMRTLSAAFRVLKRGGKIMVLQPNIRYVKMDYWMFFDHITPLCHHSLQEALVVAGFTIQKVIPRFLPYTTRSRLPQLPILVTLYLKMPFVWRFMGGQSFVIATKV